MGPLLPLAAAAAPGVAQMMMAGKQQRDAQAATAQQSLAQSIAGITGATQNPQQTNPLEALWNVIQQRGGGLQF